MSEPAVDRDAEYKVWEELVKYTNDKQFKKACRALVSDEELAAYLTNKPPPVRKVGDTVWFHHGEYDDRAQVITAVTDEDPENVRFSLGYSKGWGRSYLLDCCYVYTGDGEHRHTLNGNWVRRRVEPPRGDGWEVVLAARNPANLSRWISVLYRPEPLEPPVANWLYDEDCVSCGASGPDDIAARMKPESRKLLLAVAVEFPDIPQKLEMLAAFRNVAEPKPASTEMR